MMAAAGAASDRVQSFVRGFGGDDRVLPHLQELDERLPHGAVVFDDEDDGRRFRDHRLVQLRTGLIVCHPAGNDKGCQVRGSTRRRRSRICF